MALAIAGDQFLIDELIPLFGAGNRRFRTGIYAQAESSKYYKNHNHKFHGAILSMSQFPGTPDFIA